MTFTDSLPKNKAIKSTCSTKMTGHRVRPGFFAADPDPDPDPVLRPNFDRVPDPDPAKKAGS